MDARASLMELLEGLHDPRCAKNKRHPLPALLSLAVVGMLAGMTSYEAIVQYGKERGWGFLQLLGFTTKWGLCKATYSRVFRRIDVVDFEARVGRWIQAQLGKDDAPHLSIDGKTARGSRDGSTPGVHLVSAYAPDVKAVLAQLRVDAKTNEHKAALELLAVLAVKDKIITGDAMFTHRAFCAKVIEGGGDYVLPVKENQPTLGKDIAAAFAEPEAGLSPLQAARREAEVDRDCEIDKGHGRIEKRSIEVTSSMAEYLGSDWPGCASLPPDAGTQDWREGRNRGGARDRELAARTRRCEGTAGADPQPLGDRERPARRAGRDAPRGRQPDQERVGDAGDGHREEHRHLRLQPAGLQERRGRHASLRLPPSRDTGNPVKTNLGMKRPCPQAISLSDQSLQNESIWEQWRLQPIPTP